jgi:hypothetical protein
MAWGVMESAGWAGADTTTAGSHDPGLRAAQVAHWEAQLTEPLAERRLVPTHTNLAIVVDRG